MKYGIYAGLLFLFLIVQTTLAPYIGILGVKPDIVGALLITLAITQGPFAGAVMGGSVGLIMDLMFMSPGFYALQYLILCLLAGFVSRSLRFDRLLMPALTGFAGFTLKEFVALVYLYFNRVEIEFSAALLKLLLGGAYTMVIMLPLYWGLLALNRLPFMRGAGTLGEGDPI